MKRWLVGAGLALVLLACRQEASGNSAAPAAADGGAQLSVITGLPIFFGEGFTLDAPKSRVLAALETKFTVTPVDGPEQLPSGGLLLAAQPRAMTSERLVALDRWVRNGGRLLLLADPRLEWRSDLPLGNPERPPFQFADTGLLAHWGLVLTPPAEPGPKLGRVAGQEVLLGSPGVFAVTKAGCRIDPAGLIARCRLGKGRATVIADADFIQLDDKGGIDGPVGNNLPALLAELEALSPR